MPRLHVLQHTYYRSFVSLRRSPLESPEDNIATGSPDFWYILRTDEVLLINIHGNPFDECEKDADPSKLGLVTPLESRYNRGVHPACQYLKLYGLTPKTARKLTGGVLHAR